MDHPDRKNATPSAADGDGVRVTEHGARRSRVALLYKLAALMLVGCCVGYVLMNREASSGADDADTGRRDAREQAVDSSAIEHAAAAAPSASVATAVARRVVAQQANEPGRDPNDLSNYIAPGDPVPSAAEVIEELHKAGIYSGIGAFPPPGTSPPLVGLAVPDDYALPEGYVRHSQATDDGQRIEPILMYSPDFEFFDASGKPIKIPDNRVVPPDMAPPGLPIRLIKIPPALEPRSPSV
jgi:hypothetical protein